MLPGAAEVHDAGLAPAPKSSILTRIRPNPNETVTFQHNGAVCVLCHAQVLQLGEHHCSIHLTIQSRFVTEKSR